MFYLGFITLMEKMLLSDIPFAQKWLSAFENQHRELAFNLINEILLVSRDEFVKHIESILVELTSLTEPPDKIGFYAERQVKKNGYGVCAFFKNSKRGRAEGGGSPPVVADPRDQEVGSEGIVANIITDFCRRHRSSCFSHPGPTKLRKEKVRKIVLVTDFIGSGKRICEMLDSLNSVATLKSWKSYGLIKYIVVSYSGTERGVSAVRNHRLKPEVKVVIGCPTIENTFKGDKRKNIEDLCSLYPKGVKNPLGFEDGGALIAFAHGCPNNAPPILHSRHRQWEPLFKGRSTADIASAFPQDLKNCQIEKCTNAQLKMRKARGELSRNKDWISIMRILDAIQAGSRTAEVISSKCRMFNIDVQKYVILASNAGWIDNNCRITGLGRAELSRLKKRRRRKPLLLDEPDNSLYYPTQLRVS